MNPDWNEISDVIQREIDINREIFSKKRISDIQHYLDHGEYEMAFEYLYLEKVENPKSLSVLKPHEAKELGKQLRLNVEQIYDEEFWSKFEKWTDECC